jgi:hypothetical protein
MFYSFNPHGNKKTAIPTTTSAQSTCPSDCPLKGAGCYADNFPMVMHWRKLSEKGLEWSQLLYTVRALPKGVLWRHNAAGDLQHSNGAIDSKALDDLVKANKGRRGFTYTHHAPSAAANAVLLRDANREGFTVNLSSNDLKQADDYQQYSLPVVTLVNADKWVNGKRTVTPRGILVVRCPAEYQDDMTCSKCGLCQIDARDYIIGFTPHGTKKKQAARIATTTERV